MSLKYEEQISMSARVSESLLGGGKCQLFFWEKKQTSNFVGGSQILPTSKLILLDTIGTALVF